MVSGNFTLKAGEAFTIPWQAGKVTKIAFFCDNNLTDAANGIAPEPPQKFRIAIRDAAGKGVETLHIAVGHDPKVTADTNTGTYTHPLTSASTVAYVTREDAGTKNVGFVLV